MSFVVTRSNSNRRSRWPRIYHRDTCVEVTSKRGNRPENWIPFDPRAAPFANRPRPCKRCLRDER